MDEKKVRDENDNFPSLFHMKMVMIKLRRTNMNIKNTGVDHAKILV